MSQTYNCQLVPGRPDVWIRLDAGCEFDAAQRFAVDYAGAIVNEGGNCPESLRVRVCLPGDADGTVIAVKREIAYEAQ